MKNTLFPVLSAVLISTAANAQTDTTTKPQTDTTKPAPTDTTTTFRLMHQSSYAAYAQDTTKPADTTKPEPKDSATTYMHVHTSAHAAYALADTTKPGDTTKPETENFAATNDASDASATTNGMVTVDSNLPEHLKGVTSATIRPEHYLPVLGTYQSTGSTAQDVTITVDEQNVGIVWIDGLAQGRIKALLKKSPAIYKIPAQKTEEGKSVAEGVLYYEPSTKEVTVAIGSKYNEEEPTAVITENSKSVVYKGSKQEAMATTTNTEVQPAQQ